MSTVKGKYWHSNNIFSVDQVIVKRKNTSISEDKVSSVAVVKDASYNNQTKLLYVNSDEQIKKYDSVKECMEAVRTEKLILQLMIFIQLIIICKVNVMQTVRHQ